MFRKLFQSSFVGTDNYNHSSCLLLRKFLHLNMGLASICFGFDILVR